MKAFAVVAPVIAAVPAVPRGVSGPQHVRELHRLYAVPRCKPRHNSPQPPVSSSSSSSSSSSDHSRSRPFLDSPRHIRNPPLLPLPRPHTPARAWISSTGHWIGNLGGSTSLAGTAGEHTLSTSRPARLPQCVDLRGPLTTSHSAADEHDNQPCSHPVCCSSWS